MLAFITILFYIDVAFSVEKGYYYTQDDIKTAQDEIRRTMPPEIYAHIWNPNRDPKANMVDHIRSKTPEFKRTMIDFARKMAYPIPGVTDHNWEMWGLFMYGDEATIHRFVSKWFDEGEDRHYGQHLLRSSNPEAIRLTGPYLFDDTPIPNIITLSERPLRKSEWVANQFGQYEAIAACVEFPPEVRQWSRRLGATAPPAETELAILRRWWKENEAAFQAREYERVKPGVLSIPGMPRSVMANPPVFDEEAASTPEPPRAPSTPAATPTSADAASAPAATSHAAASQPISQTPAAWVFWASAAAAIMALGSLLYFWKGRA